MDIGTWAEVSKRLGKDAGLKRAEISPHSFSHAFRKQVRFFLDDQVATVLAGHKIEGSEELLRPQRRRLPKRSVCESGLEPRENRNRVSTQQSNDAVRQVGRRRKSREATRNLS